MFSVFASIVYGPLCTLYWAILVGNKLRTLTIIPECILSSLVGDNWWLEKKKKKL
jgi:hypothetical protein